MKTTTEYCMLAWKELRAQFKQACMIEITTVTICMVAACMLYGPYFWFFSEKSVAGGLMSIVVSLLSVLIVGVFHYYLPIWFITLIRRQQPWYETKTGFLRALTAAIFVLLPSIFSDILSGISEALQVAEDMSPTIKMGLLMIVGSALLFVLVLLILWPYAVGHILPFRVYDHPDRSVVQSVRDTIRMMRGYKLKLFLIDLLIMVVPVVIFIVMFFVLVFAVAFVEMLAPGYTVLAAVIAGVLALPFVAVFVFVVDPMNFIAHALFYEDMCAELGIDTPTAKEETETT